ncbi:hypothetical protein MFLO_11330 [Listeria floridensis FSL S10-1187]|uniref:Phage protein n=1 Tax=Listeria floridensis FSL S10-1187 TaxID=1265817 RepID=A0ABP3AWE4_9LIST|nr:hypothetical protein [Listeria floridensis]EUJ29175.1 hypothetical protein MFLO_11330 [Listeria floridensis FSL S10-1187]
MKKKKEIIDRFTELTAKPISLNRVNYHYPESQREKTILVKHLHPNGNGFIYAPYLEGETELDKEGYVNIYEASEEELTELIQKAIDFMNTDEAGFAEGEARFYQDQDKNILKLVYENKVWIVYDFDNVEAVFKSLEQAESYLSDEGFFEEKA